VEAIRIEEYQPEFQPSIDEMMVNIQKEFNEEITSKHSTVLKDVYQLPRQKYWVAFHEQTVIGTIGMVLHCENSAVVKRMMVSPQHRGNKFPTAKVLLETGFDWAKKHGVKSVYLGTMKQFVGAQKFYMKNGFVEIRKDELPADYDPNPMDTLYYKLIF
jgi:N-acetylglutamate synthase-like GNAT family acetyltransferase